MDKKIKTAMLLAAGRGERMRPLTDDIPKPLLMIGNEPLIVHHIRALALAGIETIVINHAYLGFKIEQYLGDGHQYGVKIIYSSEGEALETGGGIFNALTLLGEAPFIVVNGDVWTDYDFSQLRLLDDDAHLVLIENPPHHLNGDFVLEANRITPDEDAPKFTYSGIAVFKPEFFSDCQPGKFPLAPLLRSAIENGKVSGEYFNGTWIDVGTPERLEQVRRLYSDSNH